MSPKVEVTNLSFPIIQGVCSYSIPLCKSIPRIELAEVRNHVGHKHTMHVTFGEKLTELSGICFLIFYLSTFYFASPGAFYTLAQGNLQ